MRAVLVSATNRDIARASVLGCMWLSRHADSVNGGIHRDPAASVLYDEPSFFTDQRDPRLCDPRSVDSAR
jgi:hypothetical protein